jgi:hypothetical protein
MRAGLVAQLSDVDLEGLNRGGYKAIRTVSHKGLRE